LLGLALVGVVISVYYYFGMVRAVFWSAEAEPGETVDLDFRQKCFVYFCLAGNLILGLMPDWFLGWADQAVKSLRFV
jgi:NADH:ubiquinone oxidoreductase subunit 2 (subunit N)